MDIFREEWSSTVHVYSVVCIEKGYERSGHTFRDLQIFFQALSKVTKSLKKYLKISKCMS